MPLPSDRWTRFLLAPVLVFVAACVDRNYQTDLWHHLARGRAIVTEGQLLDHDRFTFTVAGQPFRDVNWIWQVIFFRLHELGGLPLLQVVNAAVLALMMALLQRMAWGRSGSLPAAVIACVLAFFGLWQLLLIRPQTFSLLLFVLLYGVLSGAARRRWLLLLPPVLMALWANLHGGFPIGLVLIGCHAVAAALPGAPTQPDAPARDDSIPRWRVGLGSGLRNAAPWLICLVAAVAATLVNPYGWRVYEYVRVTATAAPSRGIDEWLPPGTHGLAGKVWALSLLLTLALFALPQRRPSWRDLCLVCGFLPLACGSVRMLAWWLLVLAPILADRLVALWPRLTDDDSDRVPSAGAAIACGLLLGVAMLSMPWLERYNPALSLTGRAQRTEDDLQQIADRLTTADRTGRVFTRLAWGEYLGWSLAPRYVVFMDGRIEIFPDEVWQQYAAITRGRADWEEVLAGYGVDHLLLDTSGYHQALLPLVRRSRAWREVMRQGNAVLFERAAATGGGA